MIRSFLFNIYFYTSTFLLALFAYGAALFSGSRVMRKILHHWTRVVLFGVRTILGGTVSVEGEENLPQGGPFLLVSKHQSELDAVLLLNRFPELGAIAMQELENYPMIGRIVRALDYILVPVSGPPAGRTGAVLEGAERMHAQGRPVLIYPEGTLMSLGAQERYRSGVWRIYQTLNVPATPIAMSVGVIWPRREWRKYANAKGAARILPAIPPGLSKDDFMARIESEIESETMAMIEAHARPDIAAAARERKAQGLS